MQYTYTAIIIKENKWFVARCAELGVVSQGKTQKEAEENLQEAVALYLEDNTQVFSAPVSKPVIKTDTVVYV